MEANKILTVDFLDLLFENRNKNYGAYELRKTYHRRVVRALAITSIIALLVVTGSVLAGSAKGARNDRLKLTDINLLKIDEEVEKIDPPPPPPPPQRNQPDIQMRQFTPPRIVNDEDVQQPPPEQNELKDVLIDVLNKDGDPDMGIIRPVDLDQGKGVIVQQKSNPDEIFTKVEIEATFKGGIDAWTKYLERNLRAEVGPDNGAPAGVYRVIVQFVVSKTGVISDVRPLTDFGYGMEAEAVRVIRKGPDWEPAIQNGERVSAFRQQPITFKVE